MRPAVSLSSSSPAPRPLIPTRRGGRPSSSAPGALALAALVGAHSPALGSQQKQALADMLDGSLNFPFNAPISVAADSVACRQSDVDISHHDCTLKFGAATRDAERPRSRTSSYATLIENGVPSDGAAGSSYESVSRPRLHDQARRGEAEGRRRRDLRWAPGP